MGLVIDRTNAQYEIDRIPSKLDIQTQNARLDLHQKQAKVNIKTEMPRVLIDQYEAFASSGLKNSIDLAKEAAQLGYQQFLKYIGKKVDDGHALAAIEKGGNPIAEIARRDSLSEKEFGYDYMPKTGPKIEVTGSVQFDPEPNGEGILNGVEGEYHPGSININYTPDKIQIHMKQYGSLDIHYEDSKLDYKL
jgi:hypothetical protein